MLAPLLLLWPMSVALTWLVAQGIANRPYDRELGEMARTLARQVVVRSAANGAPQVRLARCRRSPTEMLRADDTDGVYYQVLGARGEHVAGDTRPAGARRTKPRAARRAALSRRRGARPSRCASPTCGCPAPTRSGAMPPLVQVAETLDKRSQLATEIIKGVILPQFVILPLAVLLVWLALARGIAPLNELQQRIRRRDSDDLSPIDEREAPEEVAPLVRAINDLLARLDQSIGAQKHFLADAAHQLKTPLAGLRTQAELAQREIDAGQQRSAGAEALAAADRPLEPARGAHGQPAAGDGARRRQGAGAAHAGACAWRALAHRGGARLRAARDGKAHRPRLRRARERDDERQRAA